jgi:hypothetical protein
MSRSSQNDGRGMTKEARATLLKFSTNNCQACLIMRGFDARVAHELDLEFIDVNMKDPLSYGPHRQVLLRQHPQKGNIALPTYLLVQSLGDEFVVLAELCGAMPENLFRNHLSACLTGNQDHVARESGSESEQ